MPDYTTYGTGYNLDGNGPYPNWVSSGLTLPNKFVLPFREPVYNQGQANNSPLYAVTSLKAQSEFQEHRTYYSFNSEIFYKSVKDIDGIPEEGSNLSSCVQVLTSYGYLADEEKYKLSAPLPFPILGAYKLASVVEIKDAIYSGRPVLIGMDIDAGFRKPKVEGVIPEPNNNPDTSHAFIVYGWDDEKDTGTSAGALYIKNSWGNEWANNGFAWMSYQNLIAYDFDAWCVDDAQDTLPQ